MKTQSTDFGIFVGLLNKTNATKYSVKQAQSNPAIVAMFTSIQGVILGAPVSTQSTKSKSWTITHLETATNCRALVYKFLKNIGPSTRQEIASFTSLRLSSVCGRVNELIADNKLVVIGTVIDPNSNREVELIAVKSEDL